jgi:hypothetical protein
VTWENSARLLIANRLEGRRKPIGRCRERASLRSNWRSIASGKYTAAQNRAMRILAARRGSSKAVNDWLKFSAAGSPTLQDEDLKSLLEFAD